MYKIPETTWLSLPVKADQPFFISKSPYWLSKINREIKNPKQLHTQEGWNEEQMHYFNHKIDADGLFVTKLHTE